MDFGGVLTMDGFSTSSSSVSNSNDAMLEHNKGLFGSTCLKHGRSNGDFDGTQDLGFAKMARTETKMRGEATKEDSCRPGSRSLFPSGAQMLSFSSQVKENGASPYYYHHYPSVNELSMSNNGIMGRVRGPFTPTQWMELEHQALIYKYIVENAPVPTILLVPIRRSLGHSSPFSPFSSFASTPLGWGSLQLGYPYISGNTDPEPGRCRRTDGKKWRCSRDAVPDQKYCERHINRGRHRSRKHVEPQRTTTTARGGGGNGGGGGGGSSSLAANTNLNRLPTKETTTNPKPLETLFPNTTTNPKPLETLFPNTTKPNNPFELTNGWAETRSNTTDLSIVIPMASSDFSSSSSPNNQDNLTLTPLTLSCNFNGTVPVSWDASLGGPLGEVLNNTSNNSNNNYNNNNAAKDQIRNYALGSSLNLMRDGWDLDLGHNLDSSPTGVLKNNFGSVSSSNASSPRQEIGAMCHDLIVSTIVKPHSITLL
ncbi:hypothetical protein LUZ60_004697 [Juncus effusus]|nr:hypothetical protein LUZ60_004697 [Juncus effusus]